MSVVRVVRKAESPMHCMAQQPCRSKGSGEADSLNLEQVERQTIAKALRRSGGNLTRAAEYLGITRYALYRKMEKLGL